MMLQRKAILSSIVAAGLMSGCVSDDGADDCVTEVNSRIEPGTVWGEECKTIALLENEGIYEGTLTILPGTTIIASDDALLQTRENGTINAVGTADEPIVFEAESGQPGSWLGIIIFTDSTENVMEHVVVRHTGAGTGAGDGTPEAITIPGSVTLRNITIADTAEGGIDIDAPDGSMDASDLTFRNIGSWPFQTTFASADDVPTSFTLENVTEEYVSITDEPLTEAVTWEALSIPYRLMGDESTAEIHEGGALTVTEGAVVEMGQNEYVFVNTGGTLSVLGTADSPVTIRGAEAIPGFWRNIAFVSSSTENIIDHAVIEHGGGAGYGGSEPTNIAISGGATIRNTEIRNTPGDGITVFSTASLATIENVTYDVDGDDVVDNR